MIGIGRYLDTEIEWIALCELAFFRSGLNSVIDYNANCIF